MDQIEQDQATMRSEMLGMKTQMNQLMEVIQNMARSQEEMRQAAERSANQTLAGAVPNASGAIPIPVDATPTPVGAIPTSAGAVPINTVPPPVGTTHPHGTTIPTQVQYDDHEGFYENSGEAYGPQTAELEKKFNALQEMVKTLQGPDVLGLDAAEICLVPGVKIPPKFVIPTFEKYKGNSCPKTHIRSYCRKMAAYSDDEKLLIHFFQDSLTEASLEWYMHLERSNVRSWKELADAFVKHYQYNTDMAPNRMQLQNLTQKPNECFKDFAQRWRGVAARVQPPLMEKELTDLFMGTLQGPIFERLASTTSTVFSELVMAGERLESFMKAGKIQNAGGSASGVKKPYQGFVKKREGETSAVFTNGRRTHQGYHHIAAIAPQQPLSIPANQPASQQNRQQQPYQPRQNQYQGQRKPERRLDPIPSTYAKLLPFLLKAGLVQLREMKDPPAVLPYGYDVNARCEFHSGAPGHSIENCKALKYIVQNLIDSKAINFTRNTPNIKSNPMPPHHSTNMIEGSKGIRLISDIEKLRTPLSTIKEQLLLKNIYPGCPIDCHVCMDGSQGCAELKKGIQGLMEQGVLVAEQLSKIEEVATLEIPFETLEIPYDDGYELWIPVNNSNRTPLTIPCDEEEWDNVYGRTPIPLQIPYDSVQIPMSPPSMNQLVISTPSPFPYESTKAVPWLYDETVFLNGQKVAEEDVMEEKKTVGNIVGTGGVTRSGRIFAPIAPPVNSSDNTRKGTAVPSTSEQGQSSKQKGIPNDEAEEFLRIIQKSDYKVIDQLNQTPSKISMLSLLMCSKAHQEALLKFLKAAHVPEEISVVQFEEVVGNIASGHILSFNDSELPPEGKNHNKALHITIECVDVVFSRVLVDTGSSLNVLPKSSLCKLSIEGLVMKPSQTIVKAFDGAKRTVVGEVDLPIKIGPHTFIITFYVMDIYPAYSCLLGRPWIHSAGAVTSTLHQKIKFMINNQMVIIEGEEDVLVSHLASFRYVEIGNEVHETPFQAFEVINVEMIYEKPASSIVTWKDARTVIEEGHPRGWGRVLELPVNKNGAGLGYKQKNATDKGKELATPLVFTSGGHLVDGQVMFLETEAEDHEELCMVYPRAPNQVLNNWRVVEIPEVTLVDE